LDEPMISRRETGREALEKSLNQKIRFWYHLGYDAFWQGPVLELQGLLRLVADDTAPLAQDDRRWVDEKAGVITNWAEFERYPWPRTTDADLYPMGTCLASGRDELWRAKGWWVT
jgi:hypothetical protein